MPGVCVTEHTVQGARVATPPPPRRHPARPLLRRPGLGSCRQLPPYRQLVGSPGSCLIFGPTRPPRGHPFPNRAWEGLAGGWCPGMRVRGWLAGARPLCPPLTVSRSPGPLIWSNNPSHWSKPTVSLIFRERLRTFSPFWGAGPTSSGLWPPLRKCSRGMIGSPLPSALRGPWCSDRARMWRLSSHTICSSTCGRTGVSERAGACPVSVPKRRARF